MALDGRLPGFAPPKRDTVEPSSRLGWFAPFRAATGLSAGGLVDGGACWGLPVGVKVPELVADIRAGSRRPNTSRASQEYLQALDRRRSTIVIGIAISPLSSIWYSGSSSSFHTARPTIEPNEVITIATGGSARITVDSPVIPAQVFVREFTGYDAEGISSDERPTIECVTEGRTCALDSDGESVTAAVELDSATVFVTVEVYYHIDSLDAEYHMTS